MSNLATVAISLTPDGATDWYADVLFYDHPDFRGLEVRMIPITNACSENEAVWNTGQWVGENVRLLAEVRKRMDRRNLLPTHILNVATGRIERALR